MPNFEQFTISQAGILILENKVLILEDASKPGKWLIPGGRIDKGEDSEVAFRREIKEEIGFGDFEIHDLIDHEVFYYGKNRAPKCALIYYIKNDSDEIVLSPEHINYAWISESQINSYTFVWGDAPRMLRKGLEFHNRTQQ